MNWNRLALVTPPDVTVKVLPLADAKAHLNVDFADDDPKIQAAIDDAVAQVDGPNGIGLALITQTWRLSLDRWPHQHRGIVIPLRPVQAIVSVTYTDANGVEQTLAAADYECDLDHQPATVYRPFGGLWPFPKIGRGVIKVTFDAGFGDAAADIPADLIGALKLIVGHRYANREAVIGVDKIGNSTELPLGASSVFARYAGGLVG